MSRPPIHLDHVATSAVRPPAVAEAISACLSDTEVEAAVDAVRVIARSGAATPVGGGVR